MISREPSPLLESLLGQIVVVDLRSSYVCLGTLTACDEQYLELRDADLHDFRDSTATREVYIYDSVRLGIRRNRERSADPPGRCGRHRALWRYFGVVTSQLAVKMPHVAHEGILTEKTL